MNMNINMGKITQALEGLLDIISSPEVSPLTDDYVAINKGEQNKEFTIGVPGCTKSDVRLTKAGDKLMIYVRGKMVKSLFLTKSIDREKIKSSVANGVLTIDFSRAIEFEEEELNID